MCGIGWCAPVALFGVARAGRDPWGTAGSLSRAIVYTLVPIRTSDAKIPHHGRRVL